MKPLIARIAMVLFLVLAFSGRLVAKEGPGPQGVPPAGLTVSADRDAAVDQSARNLAKLSLHFVENQGQWNDKSVRFATWRKGVAAAFREETIRLFVGGTSLGLTFEGASKKVSLEGEEKHETRYNFFIGNDPGKWREAVPVYGALLYRGLYPGVDVRVREAAGQLEYDLLLARGVDLTKVVVRVDGASAFEIGKDGVMTLKTAAGPLRQTPPKSWEVSPNGEMRPIASRFRKIDEKRYGFEAPGHDPKLALIIDPGLEWSTYLGGAYTDQIGPAVAAKDGSGDIFVGGTTQSPDFPLLADPSFSPPIQTRAFVARLNASGSALVYASFFGGWFYEEVSRGLAVDAAGNAVLAGQTWSPDFPRTAGAFDQTCLNKDAFVVRLNPTGGLIFSTCLGGDTGEDYATAVAYDPSGAIIVGGTTNALDFPTTAGAFDRTYNAPNAPADGGAHGDMFLARLSADGTQLTYGTYLGGPSQDVLEDLVVDANGFVTLAGWASGNNVQVFVTTAGAFDTTWNGSLDAVIARLKLDGAGSADLKYATLIGGSFADELLSVALDPTNSQLVTFGGVTLSDDFPVTAGVVKPTNPVIAPGLGNQTGLLVRFQFPATGSPTRVWATYHEGDLISRVTVNNAGQPIAVGAIDTSAHPAGLPTTRGAFDRTIAGVGGSDAFVSRLDANATQYLYLSYLGGRGSEEDSVFLTTPQIGYVSGNTVIVTGRTGSPDFPTTPGALDTTFGVTNDPADVRTDGFVAKFTTDPDASGDLTADPPTLVSPADGATFKIGDSLLLEWSTVTDPSGVEAYEFEMNTNSGFPLASDIFHGSVSGTEVLLPPTSRGFGDATYFWRVRTADRAGNLSAWSTVRSFSKNFNNPGQTVPNDVQAFPNPVIGGTQATGMLILYDPAPTGGVVVKLSAHLGDQNGIQPENPLPVPITIPATITIPAGGVSAPFTITTVPVSRTHDVWIVATVNGVGKQGHLIVIPSADPAPNGVSFVPQTVQGGTGATGTVTLAGKAPTGGTIVSLASSHPAAASVPATVTVPAGAVSASFPITTSAVSTEMDVRIEARVGSNTWARNLLIRSAALPNLSTMTVSPTTIAGGASANGTLTFSGPIPAGTWPGNPDNVINFTSSNPSVLGVIGNPVTIPAGSTSLPFTLFTVGDSQARSVTLSAAYNGVTRTQVLTVNAAPAATVSSVTANQTTLKGGEGSLAFVNLAASTSTSTLLMISTNHPEAFDSLPATLTIFNGTSSGMFSFVTSKSVTATVQATVTATFGASAKSVTLTINPSDNASPPILSLSLSPTSVGGGGTSTGTVTLQSAAPTGGSVVSLFSSNTSVATVPTSVTVPAGATTANFTVTTSTVSSSTTVQISGLLHLTAVGALTVTTGGAPPTITSTPVTTANVGQAYSYQATATGTTPITWSLVTGPSGMTIGASTGLVSWTPSATGSFPVTIRAANSAGTNDQPYTITVSAATNTGFLGPTTNAAETSSAGDNNGYQTNPANAHTLNGLFAVDTDSGTNTSTSCTDSGKDKHRFYNYGFSIPTGSTIRGIEVRLDAKVDSTSGSPKICIQLSWNGGASWTTAKSTATLGTTLQTFTLGSPTDTWGRTWALSDFTNANFRVRVIDVASSTSRDFSLDWVAVRVSY